VPKELPSLLRAHRLHPGQQRSGFDWAKVEDVFGKLDEELEEFKEALEKKDKKEMEDELGDIFFVLVNILTICRRQCRRGTEKDNLKIHFPLPLYRDDSRRRRPAALGYDPRRDGRPLERSKERRKAARHRLRSATEVRTRVGIIYLLNVF